MLKPLKRIAITGPESTGKTWLAQNLARRYHTVAVPEFSVEYLSEHGPAYTLEDIVNIAKGQLSLEEQYAAKANRLLFCDTDLIVCKIWSEVVFKKVPEWIDKMVRQHRYDLYLLCSPDVAWQPGPFRENPEDRDYLFDLYETELVTRGFPYAIISGEGKERLENAVKFVEEIILQSI
ncbi:MAG: ATP-binding protein [Chlorobi bacterium]|nr:ATP-binding protein [Chlorobiota bacterium]